MTQSVFSQNALDQACVLPPYTTVCSTDLLPASLLVHIGSDTLRSPFLPGQQNSRVLKQESHWPGMSHITTSGQLLRPRTPGLFWVTFSPLARRVTLHLGGTPGGRSLSQRESGSWWWRKMLCEESNVLMMTSTQGQAWCPGSGGTSVTVPWSLCSAKTLCFVL